MRKEEVMAIIALITVLAVVAFAGCSSAPGPEKRAGDEAGSLPDFDSLWDFNDPEGTEAKFRDLLPQAERSGNTSYHGQLLTQIARAQGLQRDFDRAHHTLDAVESMLTGDMIVARVRYLLERGRVFNSSNKPEDAKPLFLEAWEVALANGADYYALDAAHMMAIAEPPEGQLVWADKAMELAERTTDERARKWLGPLYNNTGWTYHDLGQYDKALELFEKSLKWREGQQDEDGIRIANWTIARAYRSLGRVEEALEMQLRLAEERRDEGLDPSGYVFEEIAECMLLLGRDEEARPYFGQAYDILSRDEWLVANQADRLARLKQLAGEGDRPQH
jgi:tetratricopeptide (TPR) repeat protein